MAEKTKYRFLTGKPSVPKDFDSDKEAIEEAKKINEVLRVQRVDNAHVIWERPKPAEVVEE